MGNPRKANGARRRHVVRWLRSQGRPCWICGLPIDYGVPPGNPGAFECDELVPVSRGGSPFDRDNVAAAHRCCNNWRRARSVAEVSAVRRALREHLAAWNSPESFVELCKALKSERIPFISPRPCPRNSRGKRPHGRGCTPALDPTGVFCRKGEGHHPAPGPQYPRIRFFTEVKQKPQLNREKLGGCVREDTRYRPI